MGRWAAKRCGARASGATEFVAFVTSQYLPDASGGLGVCGPFVCSLVQWAQQVHRLASGVQALAGEPASVHLFTPCLPPSMADTLSDGGRGARVVLHRQHAPPLHQRHLRHRIGVEGRLAQRVVRDRHGWPLRMPCVQAHYGADSRMRRIMWVVETALV